MRILLVEPNKSKKYHTPYPPLALLKLAAYHRQKRNIIKFVQGFSDNGFDPNIIYITSLFTYAYEPVHDVIRYYSKKYKRARIVVGGIYATLCSGHLRDIFKERIEIHKGLIQEVEDVLPDYSLFPEWNASILFSCRGCIRRCPFCSVPILEPKFEAKKSIKHLIYPGHKKAIFWDNNILASPFLGQILDELEESNLEVDFNQGLDARLLNGEIGNRLMRLKMPLLRLAYDSDSIKSPLKKAINLLKNLGVRGRKIIIYCLYNHLDSAEDFLNRIKDILEWGAVVYPMRYEPLKPMPKNSYVSPNWTAEQLEMVAKARRVIGYGGAFPPYDGIKKKFFDAKSFEEAFELRPIFQSIK
jgi:hypothetical protein